MTTPDLDALAGGIVARAGTGEQLEAFVARGHSSSVRAYGGEVESFTSADSFGVGIRVIADQRQGFAHCGTFDEAVVAETLAEARDNARFGAPDEHYGLATPDGVPAHPVDLWRDELVAFSDADKVTMALDLEAATVAADPRVTGVRAATYGDGAGEAAVATSTGLAISSRATSCSVGVSALAVDGDETQTGGSSDGARRPDDLDLDQVVDDAVGRAVRLLGASQPPSSRLAILLEPQLAAAVLGIVGGTLTGERVLKGRSFFADRVGEAIASELVTLVDDPTDPASFGADSHDGEGLATRRNPLITDGVLEGFLQNAYTGRRSGTASTGSAVRGYRSRPGVGCQALSLTPGTLSFDDLVAGIDDGLLVQSLKGLHSGVNAVSGDFSVGADGLVIRGGEVCEPVREVTLASTVPRMLLDVIAVGSDLEYRPSGTSTPSMVIRDVTMSGR